MREFLKLTMLCMVLLIAQHIAKAQNNRTPYEPGELIIKFKEGNTSAKASHLATKMQAKVVKTMPGLGLELWKVNQSNARLDVTALVEANQDHPDIEYIEPNYLYTISDAETIDDIEFGKQWGLHNTGEKVNGEAALADADIDAPEAWGIQSASPSIVVGILDTGVDWRHPDLIDNIWQNQGEDKDGDGVLIYDEVNGQWVFDPKDLDGVDNDGNGYVDDLIGWNFVDNNNEPFDYEAFEEGAFVQSHGTHVAGIIGANGNNDVGISGVTQKVQLAPLKFLSDDRLPQGNAWNAAKAIEYAYTMGMQISNNSWGGLYDARPVEDAIREAAKNDHLFVASAGNGGWDKMGDNISAYYPATYNIENIIAVANTGYTDNLHQSSNFNLYKIDIAAPGTSIYSCLPFQNLNEPAYGYKTGTSMAAPMVAGAAALVWEKTNEVFNVENATVKVGHIKNFILENTDNLTQLKDKVATGGRLNIHKALSALTDAAYTNQYINCRQRDSTTLSIVYEALGLETYNPKYKPDAFTIDYYDTWGYDNKPMDEWFGVTLNSLGCVSELAIRYNMIEPQIKQPEIPPALGELSDLVVLNLEGNYFFEDFVRTNDQSFGNLINEYEAIPNSEFNSIIPLEIFKLKKLKYLTLGDSKIGGSIPNEIAQLKNLEYLNLSYNRLTGNIPDGLYNLSKLKEVSLSFNQLDGSLLDALEQLENLEKFHLANNNLSGNIPEALGNTKALNEFDLGYNNFEGNIPAINRAMRRVLLDHNNLTGPIPPSLSRSVWLDEVGGFDVSHNNLSGCYDPALIKLGSSFYYEGELDEYRFSLFYNSNVSDGNDFEVAWEEFVSDETAGSCWASETTQVWPGDMNNDGSVTMDDIVYYRIANGNAGDLRPADNMEYADIISWKGNLGLDWTNAVYGVNGKHQDANGDGIVDHMDYDAIIANMGQVNPNHYKANDLKYYANGVEMVLKLVEDESSGIEKVFELRLNNQAEGGAVNFHTLSAELQFNETVSSVEMEFISNCIDPALSEKFFEEDTKQMSFAISRSDLVTCDDVLARVIVIVEADASDDGDKFLRFRINSINSKAGVTINETGGISNSNSISLNSNEDMFIEVNTTPETCEEGGTATANVIGGIPPYTYHWESEDNFWGSATTDSPSIYELITGNYTLTVIDNDSNEQSLSFVVENDMILELDANGNPVACQTQFEPVCVEDLNLTDNISQDTYSAANYINTDGTISKDEEVQLRAGDFIQLNPGFKMENNTFLDIKLEACSEEE